jgi:hypothetical protein
VYRTLGSDVVKRLTSPAIVNTVPSTASSAHGFRFRNRVVMRSNGVDEAGTSSP